MHRYHQYQYEYVDYQPREIIQYRTTPSYETRSQVYSNDSAGAIVFIALVVAAVVTAVFFMVNGSQNTPHGYYDDGGGYMALPEKEIKKKKRSHMPRIIKLALYLALVKLVWMAVDAAPQIAQFISSKI